LFCFCFICLFGFFFVCLVFFLFVSVLLLYMNADVCLVFKIFLCYFFCIQLINNRRIDSLSGAKRPGTKQTHIVITDNQVAETLWSMVLLKCTHFNETPTIHCIRECTYRCGNLTVFFRHLIGLQQQGLVTIFSPRSTGF
jgi:hypothetical protein